MLWILLAGAIARTDGFFPSSLSVSRQARLATLNDDGPVVDGPPDDRLAACLSELKTVDQDIAEAKTALEESGSEAIARILAASIELKTRLLEKEARLEEAEKKTADTRKRFKVRDAFDDQVKIWTVRDQKGLDEQLARRGVDLVLADDPAVLITSFDEIIPDDDTIVRDRSRSRYQERSTNIWWQALCEED